MEYRKMPMSLTVDIGTQTLRHEIFSIARTLDIDDDEIEEKCFDIVKYAMLCTALYHVEESIDQRATYLKHQFLTSGILEANPLTLFSFKDLYLPRISEKDYDSSKAYSYDSEKVMCLLKAVSVASRDVSILKLHMLSLAAEKKERILLQCHPIKTQFIPHVPYVPQSWEARCKKVKAVSSTNRNELKHSLSPQQSFDCSDGLIISLFPSLSAKMCSDCPRLHSSKCSEKYAKRYFIEGDEASNECTPVENQSLDQISGSSPHFDRAICSLIDSLGPKKARESPFERILRRKVLESGLRTDQAALLIHNASCLARDRLRHGHWKLSEELGEDYGKYPLSGPANVFSKLGSRDVFSSDSHIYNYTSRLESHVQRRMHTIHTIHPLLWQRCYNCATFELTIQAFIENCIELHRYLWYTPSKCTGKRSSGEPDQEMGGSSHETRVESPQAEWVPINLRREQLPNPKHKLKAFFKKKIQKFF